MHTVITDDLEALFAVLPAYVRDSLQQQPDCDRLLEVILDLGRPPEARFPGHEVVLDSSQVSLTDIDYTVSQVGKFTDDNRAGIDHTLHRISAMRNRNGGIIGLTCRVGRAILGTVKMIQDLVESGKSVLLLGRPGVGKTTMLREVARVLADDIGKRVIVIDTSNEIAGDGDIPHPAIGHARRMQVATPAQQHEVMIEAVENHMPEVIIIDEIGTELEAQAARTIAERGVQLVGTAHGNTLENLIMNPTLSDLVGGVQTVTLGDEEARRRRTQKSVLERKAPPTFDVVVELMDYYKVTVHPVVSEAVDAILHQDSLEKEIRWMDEEGVVRRDKATAPMASQGEQKEGNELLQVYVFGANRSRLEQVAREEKRNMKIVRDLKQSDLFVTSRSYYRRKPQKVRDAEMLGIPIYVLKNNEASQMRQCLEVVHPLDLKAGYIHGVQHLLSQRLNSG